MTPPAPIPFAQAEKPFFWALHPHTHKRIALVSADGGTDILLATGDDSAAWAEISDEHAEQLANAPALQAQNARLREQLKALLDDEWRMSAEWGNPKERRAILEAASQVLAATQEDAKP